MADDTLTSPVSRSSEPESGSAGLPTRYIPWVPLLAAVLAVGVYAIIFGVVAP